MSLIDWVLTSGYATAIRESQYIYPALQCLHIAAIGMFAGSVMMVNLRLTGVGAAIPVADFGRMAARIAWLGLAIVLLTGLHMASAFFDVFVANQVMHLKLILVLLAVGNLVLIQRGTAGAAQAPWALNPPDPARVRGWAATGIAILLTLIVLGKLLAYIGGKD